MRLKAGRLKPSTMPITRIVMASSISVNPRSVLVVMGKGSHRDSSAHAAPGGPGGRAGSKGVIGRRGRLREGRAGVPGGVGRGTRWRRAAQDAAGAVRLALPLVVTVISPRRPS